MHMSHHNIITGTAKPAKQLGKLRCRTKLSFQCYTVKATKTWHRQGSQKHNRTENRYSQPKRPSTGNTYQ